MALPLPIDCWVNTHAAVITPSGDPYSMLALAIPMSLFYLLSILIGYLVQRHKLRRAPAD